MHGDKGITQTRIGLPEAEADQSEETSEQGTENVTTLPWIRTATPVHADEEDNKTCAEKEDAYPVQRLELLQLRLAANVKHLICRRVVEEEVQGYGQRVDNNAEDVTPSPLQSGVFVEGACHWRPEDGEWDGGRQHTGVDGTSGSIWYEFA